MRKKKMPDFQGSLSDFKISNEQQPWPEGFTPGPYVGFTPGASVPKVDEPAPKPKKGKLNQDPGLVRRAQDEVRNLNSKLKGLKEAVPNNYYQPYDPEQVDWVSYVRIGNKVADIEKYLKGARKGVGKGPNKGR